LLVANYDATHSLGPSDGYTIRVNDSGDIVEDQTVSSAGSYTASVALSEWEEGPWIQQMVALKAAAGATDACSPSPCTTPPLNKCLVSGPGYTCVQCLTSADCPSTIQVECGVFADFDTGSDPVECIPFVVSGVCVQNACQ
jgi:hypothetical protein